MLKGKFSSTLFSFFSYFVSILIWWTSLELNTQYSAKINEEHKDAFSLPELKQTNERLIVSFSSLIGLTGTIQILDFILHHEWMLIRLSWREVENCCGSVWWFGDISCEGFRSRSTGWVPFLHIFRSGVYYLELF